MRHSQSSFANVTLLINCAHAEDCKCQAIDFLFFILNLQGVSLLFLPRSNWDACFLMLRYLQ